MTQRRSTHGKARRHVSAGTRPQRGARARRGSSTFLYTCLSDFSREDDALAPKSDRRVVAGVPGLLRPCYFYSFLHASIIRHQEFHVAPRLLLSANLLTFWIILLGGRVRGKSARERSPFSGLLGMGVTRDVNTRHQKINKAARLRGRRTPANHRPTQRGRTASSGELSVFSILFRL